MEEKVLKMVFLGNCEVGKTSLVYRFLKQEFNEAYTPTKLSHLSSSIKVNETIVKMDIWDIGGEFRTISEEFANKLFSGTDIFYLCFSLSDKNSLDDIKTTWRALIEPYQTSDSMTYYIGCKEDLWDDDNPPIPVEELEEIEFIDCSSKENEGVKTVFYNALRWAMTKWNSPVDTNTLIKSKFAEEDAISIILQDNNFLNIFKQMIRENDKDALEFIDQKIPEFIHHLTSNDPEVESIILSGLICDLFTAHNNILTKLTEPKHLDQLLNFLSEKSIIRRKGLIVLRLFHFLYVNKKEFMLNYTVDNQTIAKVIQNLNDYSVEFIINTLDVEKQYCTEKNIPPFLLENVDLSTILIDAIQKDNFIVSILNTLLIGIRNVRGITSNVIKKLLSSNNGAFVKYIIELLMKKPEITSDVVQLLLEFVFPVIDEVEEDREFVDIMNTVLISYKDSFSILIKSGSKLQCLYGVQLCSAIAFHSLHLLEKEHLWDCLDVMFKFPFSSAIHCLVSSMIVYMFENNVEEIINMLLDNKAKFIDRLIDEYSTKQVSKGDFYPHLELMIKSIVKNEKANNKAREYPKWAEFIDKNLANITALPGNSQIYQPNEEVMRAKEKQLMGVRAGRFTPS